MPGRRRDMLSHHMAKVACASPATPCSMRYAVCVFFVAAGEGSLRTRRDSLGNPKNEKSRTRRQEEGDALRGVGPWGLRSGTKGQGSVA